MNNETPLWLIFILIGLATTLPRASFIILGNRFALPVLVQRALRYAPAAALAAIVVPDVVLVAGTVQVWNPKLIAAAVAVITVLIKPNPWLPFILSMGTLLGLRFGLGW